MFVCVNILVLDEGVFVDGLNDVSEEDLGGERVAVMDDGFPVLTVPAVDCTRETETESGVRGQYLSSAELHPFTGITSAQN